MYDIPIIKKQIIDLSDLKLIRFSSIVKDETKDMDATVHFFEYDNRFDEVWRNPIPYIKEIGQYKQTMTPDFSMYTNMPLALQIYNVYRNRWLGAFWQQNGLTVIPTVSWSDEWSYDFCFDGIQTGSVVAVSTLNCRDVKGLFLAGFEKMCQAIDPELVICHAEAMRRKNTKDEEKRNSAAEGMARSRAEARRKYTETVRENESDGMASREDAEAAAARFWSAFKKAEEEVKRHR